MRNPRIRKRTRKRENKPSIDLKNILPNPAALESYEEVQPGFTKKLLKLAEKEQAKHYKLESFKVLIRFLGKILTFLLVLAIIFTMMKAIHSGNQQIAFGLLGIIFIISLPQLLSIASVFNKPKRHFKGHHRNNG